MNSCELDLGLAKPTQSILCLFTERFVDLLEIRRMRAWGGGPAKETEKECPERREGPSEFCTIGQGV